MAVKSAYENLAGGNFDEGDVIVAPKTMMLVKKIEDNSRASSSSAFDPGMVAELTRALNMQKATEEHTKWKNYREALQEEERRALRMMSVHVRV